MQAVTAVDDACMPSHPIRIAHIRMLHVRPAGCGSSAHTVWGGELGGGGVRCAYVWTSVSVEGVSVGALLAPHLGPRLAVVSASLEGASCEARTGGKASRPSGGAATAGRMALL